MSETEPAVTPPKQNEEPTDEEEQPPATPSSAETNGNSTKQRALTGQELKARDEELIRLIADRKRALVERGVKLTVVLLTTREMLGEYSGRRSLSDHNARHALFLTLKLPHDPLMPQKIRNSRHVSATSDDLRDSIRRLHCSS